MTIDKITSPISELELINKTNEIIDYKQDKLTPGDGITIEQEEGEWTPATYISSLGDYQWQALGYGDGKFVAMTYSDSNGYFCAISSDGSTWTKTLYEDDNNCRDITYDGTKFVALGNYGDIVTSTDGTNWVATHISNLGSHNWEAISYGNEKFVALDYSGYISTSTDGTTWTTAAYNSNLGSNFWNALAYDGTKFVALGSDGYISTSTDGTAWTPATYNSNLGSNSWRALAYDGTKFVALGSDGYVSTSTDGTTWSTATQDSNLGSNNWWALAYNGTKFLALGFDGYISQFVEGEDLVISATGGTWGNITGTLSDQTDLQNALNGKQATITGAASSITSLNLSASRALVSDSSGKVATSSITATKLGYLTDVTSNIQAQINGVSSAIPTSTTQLTNDSGFITGITSSDVTTALGYTPADTYSATNPALTPTDDICTWNVVHNLGNNVNVSIYDASTNKEVVAEVTLTNSTTAKVELFSTSNISAGAYKAVVVGA